MKHPASGMLFAAAGIAGLLAVPASSTGSTSSQLNLNLPGRTAAPTSAGAPAPALAEAARRPAVAPQAAGSGYQPPLHGTEPHGMGTAATVYLGPSASRPYAASPVGGPETVVLGRAVGYQRSDGTYHGHISILAVAGNDILSVDTSPGQSASGPLSAVQTAILDNLCKATGGLLCLNAVTANSTTTATGSTNQFEVLKATIGQSGVPALSLDAVKSDGDISSDGVCQTASGDSTIANLNLAGLVTANAISSSSQTKTCNSKGTSVPPQATSQVLGLGGVGVPLPAAGCGNGTPNTDTGLPLLLPIVCNADDTNGGQAAIPYNVREALELQLLSLGSTGLVQLTAGASESAAQAPTPTTPTPTTPTPTTPTPTTPTPTTPTPTTPTPTTPTPTRPMGKVVPTTTPTAPPTAVKMTARQLPFTGFGVIAAGALGVVLLGIGLVGRRLTWRGSA